MRISDWSSDVCSSDLTLPELIDTLVGNLPATHLPTLAIGAAATAFLFWVRKGLKPLLARAGMAPRPADLLAKTGPIAAVAASTLAVVALGLEEAGVKDRKSTRLNSSP